MICTYFILVDPRNQLDFEIDYTTMANPKLRWSAMKSCYKRYCLGQLHTYRPYFRFFESGYYTFIIIGDAVENCKSDALKKCNELESEWCEKHRNTPTSYATNIITLA